MLTGFVFVASPDVTADVREIVRSLGGAVVDDIAPIVTHGLISSNGRPENLPCAPRLRGLRIPILRESWVTQSAAAGHPLPMQNPHAAYDPNLFASLCFTTTNVPASIKGNVLAAILFYGGTYSPHLTCATNMVIHGRCGRGAMDLSKSEKWHAATARGIPCISISWLQDCITMNARRPLPMTASPILPTSSPFVEGTQARNRRGGEGKEEGLICGAAISTPRLCTRAESTASSQEAAVGRKRQRLEEIVDQIIASRMEGESFTATSSTVMSISQMEEDHSKKLKEKR